MQILKFGGASIKNSTNIKKVADILKNIDCNNTIVIVSAIGKTTNAFENIVELYLKGSDQFINSIIDQIMLRSLCTHVILAPGACGK